MPRYIDAYKMMDGYGTTFPYNLAYCNDDDLIEWLESQPTEDVVPRSEVEELQKQLNDYKKFVGEIRVTQENHAVIIDSENVTHIDKRVAEGLKNLAVKQAKQEVAREIFDNIDELIWDYDTHPCRDLSEEIAELKKKYIGEVTENE